MARHRFGGALLLLHASAFLQPPRTTLKPHAIDARRVRRVSLTAAPNSNEIDVQRTLATLIAAQVILFVGVGARIPVVAIYGRETLGLSAAARGASSSSAPALALLLGAKVGGAYADRARKPALVGGMLFIALATPARALASSLAPLVVARLGLGAGRCVSESAEQGLLADLGNVAPDSRGRAIAANQAAAAAGIALGAPLGGLLSEAYGPRACFLAVTGAALVTACFYTQLPETATAARIDDDDGVDWLLLLKDGRWRGLTAAEVCSRFGFAAKIASVPLWPARVLPGGAAGAGALVSLAGLGGLVGAPVGGFGVDRVGARATAVVSGLIGGGALSAGPRGALNGGSGRAFLRAHHPMVYGRRRPSPGAPGSSATPRAAGRRGRGAGFAARGRRRRLHRRPLPARARRRRGRAAGRRHRPRGRRRSSGRGGGFRGAAFFLARRGEFDGIGWRG